MVWKNRNQYANHFVCDVHDASYAFCDYSLHRCYTPKKTKMKCMLCVRLHIVFILYTMNLGIVFQNFKEEKVQGSN